MANILDLLRKKDPNMTLDDARSAMGIPAGNTFDMLGNYVPTQDNTPELPLTMSPLQTPVPAEPQIYREGYDPIADLDIERNPVNKPQNSSIQSKPKSTAIKADTPAKDFKLPQDDIQQINESNKEDNSLADQYAKESQDALNSTPDDLDQLLKKQSEVKSEPTLQDKFKDAQAHKRKMEDMAMWTKIGAQIGGGLGHQSKDVIKSNMDLADIATRRGDLPMQQLKEQIDMESNDPTSAYSESLRDFLKKQFNVDVPDDVSVNQLNNSMLKPLIENFKKQADYNKEALKQQQIGTRAQKSIESKEKLAEDKLNEMSRFHDITANAMQQRLGLLSKNIQDKNSRALLTQVQQGINKLSSDKNTYVTQVQRANNILHTVGLPTDITEKDVDSGKYDAQLNKLGRILGTEVGMETAGLLMRGQKPSVATFNKILPSNLHMTETEVKDFMSGKMSEAKQAPYLKAMLKTSLRIRKQNEKYFEDQKQSLLGPLGHKVKALDDDSLQQMYDSALNNMYSNTKKSANKSISELPNPNDVHDMSSEELDALDKQLDDEETTDEE